MLIFCSALMSATEVAFFSLTPAEVAEVAKSDDEADKRVHALVMQPARLLAAILVANNLFNVSIVILSAVMIADLNQAFLWAPWQRFLIEVVSVTFIILFFGEITPKVYVSGNQMSSARKLSRITTFICFILYPLTYLLTRSTRFLEKPLNIESEQMSRKDIRHAIDLTSDDESPEEEKEILKGIVNFSGIPVRSVFQARVDVKAIDINTSFHDLLEAVNEFGYSRIPVYEDSLDQVQGILYVKDLLKMLDQDNLSRWQDLIRPAYFVPESKKIDVLLDEFKAKRLHIAVVVDEYGGTAGIVTLEDILEEIFGEINDEFDTEAPDWAKISDQEFVFEGRILLNELIRVADLPEEIFDAFRGDNDSLAGLILEMNGTFPELNAVIQAGTISFHIESVTPRRIKKVRMFILSDSTDAS
jgi:putative hemolysin